MTTGTKVYDLNIYCPDDHTLTLTAYELIDTGSGLTTNTNKYHTWVMDMHKEDHDMIGFILDSEEWELVRWEDHDEWNVTDYLIGDFEKLNAWVRGLPEYEPEVQIA